MPADTTNPTSSPLAIAAEIVLPCADLTATLAFFVERLGFRVDAISPADDPSTAVISAYGLRARLQRGAAGAPGVLRLLCHDPAAFAGGATELVAPNGTRIELVDANPPLVLPPIAASFVLTRASDGAWIEGRAGMRYRDLVPDRQAGRVIASHIQIPNGGPVPDYVHFHKVRFQMIFCKQGWVRVVYEDQGPPFVLRAGDCVLQPPQIRHRVLESSPGLEVIELGSPAHHETFADHDMQLPTANVRPDRRFGEQRFVRHEAASATWRPWRHEGFEVRDTGLAAATNGVGGAGVVCALGTASAKMTSHDAELVFAFVLRGAITLRREGHTDERLTEGDSFVIPAATKYALADAADLELLDVTLPAM